MEKQYIDLEEFIKEIEKKIDVLEDKECYPSTAFEADEGKKSHQY